jgi:hypothetical protein
MRSIVTVAVVFAAAAATLGCGDAKTEPERPIPAAVQLDRDKLGFTALGDTARLSARVLDRAGVQISGSPVSWNSSDRSIATVDHTGLVRAVASGSATLSASAASASAEVRVTVVQRVADLSVTVPRPLLGVGDTTRAAARARDANEHDVAGLSLSWSSADPEIASVDEAGLVTGLAPGAARIVGSARTATDTVSASARVEIVMLQVGAITRITPATLTPGGSATITGMDFGATASENWVTIDGISATVTAATATELRISLPSFAAFGCRPTREVDVVVDAPGVRAATRHPLAVARQLPVLEPGSYLNLVAAPDKQCNELPPTGGRYLVSVYNASIGLNAHTSFRLQGVAGGEVAGPPGPLFERRVAAAAPGPLSGRQDATTPAYGRQAAAGANRTGLPESLEAARREAAAHTAILEESRKLVARLGPPRRLAPAPGLAASGLDAPSSTAPRLATADLATADPAALAAAGAMLDLRIPDINSSNLCGTFIPVRARVVYAGPHAVVLEDSIAPLAGEMDAHYQAVGAEFERSMLPVLEEYFGDPFAMDSVLAHPGRILMLFSPRINDFGGVAAFAWAGDFYERPYCAASDETKIFYAVVPTNSASGYGTGTVDSWRRSMPSTVIHEVKHITSYAERFVREARVFEESWLEESTARLAEELWARTLYGYGHRGKTTYRASIYCEVRPSWPECGERPYIMWKHFNAVHDYLRATHNRSPLGGAGAGDASFYGSGWLLVRWALDHHAGTEMAFIRALVQEPRRSGVANLEARTGKSFAELLGPWSLSLFWDAPTAPGLSHPSWDLHDIFQGLHDDYPTTFPRPYPLQGWSVPFGPFTVDVPALLGGTAALTLISGTQTGWQLLDLQDGAGRPPASALGIAIMRVQ